LVRLVSKLSKSTVSACVAFILLLYSFPTTNFYDNSSTVNGTNDIAVSAFGQQSSLPQLNDRALKVELVMEELLFPTSMIFIDNNTLLITQKNSGNVISIINGTVNSQPVINVEVDNESSRGLLGIAATQKPSSGHTKFVFLYFTELNGQDQARNRVYRYEWNQENQTLVNATMVLDLPAEPGPGHNGGKIEADRNGNIYAVIGDLNRDGQLQNTRQDSAAADDTSVIIRITQNGSAVSDNPFFKSTNERIQKYYAYGIRNSFGLAIDPISGLLWDTENGPTAYDEMNIVHPGFNSGWKKIMGPLSRSNLEKADLEEELTFFDGSKYADPILSWKDSVALTDLEFLNSKALGLEYAYNLFVGDFNNGNLYYFELNNTRTGIKLNDNDLSGLTDKVADDDQELSQIVFGTGFDGGITDIETGPDGFLYILTLNGSIYRISPVDDENKQDQNVS
jgi:aldose sugar dehydrogenase